MKSIETIGKKFNKLTILSLNHHGHCVYAVCKCDCGKIKEICLTNIVSGKQKSCGCLVKYRLEHGLTHLQHGLSKHPLHNTWDKIKARCYNKKDRAYKNYGARGICMCQEWKNNFISFYNWAVKNGYKQELSIDRIDNNGNYCPENCRWTTKKQQANNRRTNCIVCYNNKEYTIKQLSDITGIKYGTLRRRLLCGWNIQDAVERPLLKNQFK